MSTIRKNKEDYLTLLSLDNKKSLEKESSLLRMYTELSCSKKPKETSIENDKPDKNNNNNNSLDTINN